MIKLTLPLDPQKFPISQWFGPPNSPVTAKFYVELGLAGHNGIDFSCKVGTDIHACHDGVISNRVGGDGGIYCYVINKELGIQTMYYHLSQHKLADGKSVKAGGVIALSGNTGRYTTGPHLHFGLYLIDKNGVKQNTNNGYDGAIDPAAWLAEPLADGELIKNPWDPAVYLIRNQKRYWIDSERTFQIIFGYTIDKAKVRSVDLLTLNNLKYDGVTSVTNPNK